MAFTHDGTRCTDVGYAHIVLTTNTTQPLYAASLLDPMTMCSTCGAPDQSIGRKCHYCAITVQPRR